MEYEKKLRTIARLADDEKVSINKIASATKLSQTTLNNRYNQKNLSSDQVIAIAKAYGYNPVRALMLFEHLEESDFWIPSITNTLRDATDAEIVEEVARRIALGSTEDFDKPIDDVSAYIDET